MMRSLPTGRCDLGRMHCGVHGYGNSGLTRHQRLIPGQ